MSLIKTALRISAVEAIRGKTDFGDNVLDSQNGAFTISSGDVLETEQERPFIAVYTETLNADNSLGQMSLYENGQIELALEMGLAHRQLDKDDDGNTTIDVGLPATDAAMEFKLDLVMRQVKDALLDPTNEWAELFRRFSPQSIKQETVRAGQNHGTRLAAQQLKLTLDVINDPIAGEPLLEGDPFDRFLKKLENSDNTIYLNIAQRMRKLIEGTPLGESDQVLLGLSNASVEALNQTSDAVTVPSDAGEIDQLTIDGGGSVSVADMSND